MPIGHSWNASHIEFLSPECRSTASWSSCLERIPGLKFINYCPQLSSPSGPESAHLSLNAIKLDLWIAVLLISSVIVDKPGCAPPLWLSVAHTSLYTNTKADLNFVSQTKNGLHSGAGRSVRGQTLIIPTWVLFLHCSPLPGVQTLNKDNKKGSCPRRTES